ncbi:alpha-tocopherol transfer protein-like [Frankliniella occidentalis]|uniref:Alpha-tocopherol transfer protein-like n=1 Tax=Frankliniella occidentalis TaxID=133901 RepID=A0A6J1S3Q6_FRAOC|nr:alpha-tocopherol transfer protein-like [Frankliniella occidentalis]
MGQQPTEKQIESEVDAIRQWLAKQPHLPGDTISDNLLRRFLHSCDHSVERSKTVLELNCTLRNAAPEFFSQRDPLQPNVQAAFDVVDVIPLPKRTPEDYQVFLYRLSDPDPDKLVYNDYVKMLLLVADARIVSETNIPAGDVPVFDLKDVSLRHLARVVLPSLRKYMQYFQEAHPVKLKHIHIINVPPIMDKIMTLVKPLTRREVSSMIHYHPPGDPSFYDFVPKELMPKDYGGDQPSCAELKEVWRKKVIAHRDFFLDERTWKAEESKRVGGPKSNFGVEGSFRSLAID